MRSIGRLEAPRWLSDEFLKAAGARTSEPIESKNNSRESDARYSQRPGTWQMGVHHDLCPFGSRRREELRLPARSACPHGTPTVLGINLNCS